MSLPVMVLAGGLATRMRPMTETIPKALLSVAGVPFLDWQLALLQKNNIERVVLCVGYLGNQIEEHVKGKDYGLEVICSYDGDIQLGTGGALKKAAAYAKDAFFVLYGDSYLDISYSQVEKKWKESGKTALMTVFHNQDKWDTSNVQYTDHKIVSYSKSSPNSQMHYIDYGLGILSKAALEPYGQVFDLADVYSDLAKKGELAGYEATKRFYEIGSPQGLSQFIQKASLGGT